MRFFIYIFFYSENMNISNLHWILCVFQFGPLNKIVFSLPGLWAIFLISSMSYKNLMYKIWYKIHMCTFSKNILSKGSINCYIVTFWPEITDFSKQAWLRWATIHFVSNTELRRIAPSTLQSHWCKITQICSDWLWLCRFTFIVERQST